jgi:riboflavin biosynthesis pyrimidine reductase
MRPRIICHMMSSIDGRLLVDRWTAPPVEIDARMLRMQYEAVAPRFRADGWMVGRKTMEDFAKAPPRGSRVAYTDLRSTHVADRKGRGVAVAIDPQGKLHYGTDNAGGDHIVAVIGEQVSDDYLGELRGDGVSYLFAGRDGHDLHLAMNTLGEAFSVKTILLEGGGQINGAFLKQKLIDEISILVYPGIDGLAGVPSIFEYAGEPGEKPAEGQALRHVFSETLPGGMVWLRYRVEGAA